jgi:hypothetical protein
MASLSKNQRITLWIAAIVAATGIGALGVSVWSTNRSVSKSEEIAEKSGAFDRGDLRLQLGDYAPQQNAKVPVLVVLNFSNARRYTMQIPFTLFNGGKKTLENVQMVSKYPDIQIGYEVISDKELHLVATDGASRKHVTDGVLNQITTNLGTINPKETLETADFLKIRSPAFYDSIAQQTYTDIPNGATIYFSENVEVSITAKDDETKRYAFSVGARSYSSPNLMLYGLFQECLNPRSDRDWMRDGFYLIYPKPGMSLTNPTPSTVYKSYNFQVDYCYFDNSFDMLYVVGPNGSIKRRIMRPGLDKAPSNIQ